jgi:uncharacterized protein YecT (DUF1311 family)
VHVVKHSGSGAVPRHAGLLLALGLVTMLAGQATAATHALDARVVRPPVISERFTPLPCPAGQPSTTLALEGCAEQAILHLDTAINAAAAAILPRLYDRPARLRFVAGERAWLVYRNAFCTSQADVYEGGSEAPVAAATCMRSVDAAHLSALTAFRKAL